MRMKYYIGASVAVAVIALTAYQTSAAQATGASVTPKAGVQSQEREQERVNIMVPTSLANDAERLASGNANIRGMVVDPERNRVEVTYRLRAKLFGFIDVPYELRAMVQTQEGEMKAEANGPWWLIFAADNSDEVQDALEGEPTLTTATNQGTVLSTIIKILKSFTD